MQGWSISMAASGAAQNEAEHAGQTNYLPPQDPALLATGPAVGRYPDLFHLAGPAGRQILVRTRRPVRFQDHVRLVRELSPAVCRSALSQLAEQDRGIFRQRHAARHEPVAYPGSRGEPGAA